MIKLAIHYTSIIILSVSFAYTVLYALDNETLTQTQVLLDTIHLVPVMVLCGFGIYKTKDF